jgi:hypothetical protein
MRLYHYTCLDSDPGIQRDGFLRPNWNPLLRASLVWLTDLEQPNIEGLGLTSDSISCDRTAVRYEVRTVHAERWAKWARKHRVSRPLRDDLERFGLPRCWWVATTPLPVIDRILMSEVAA